MGGFGQALGDRLGKKGKDVRTLADAQYNQQATGAYLNALGMAMSGGGQPQGGGGGGYRYSGGGGGGGGYGPSAYDQWRIAEEKRRREELEKQKRVLELGLAGSKKAAVPRIKQYGVDATSRVNKAYAQNAQQTKAYNTQLAQLGGNMRSGAANELAMLNRDIGAQGGGGADMRALQAAAQQNVQGQNFLQNNAQAFNNRLAQVQSGARADSLSTAGTVTSAGLADLENNYLQALMQIRMMGLTGG